jgi:hypothetical protein
MSLENIIQKRLQARSHAFIRWRTASLYDTHMKLSDGWLRNQLGAILATRAPA